MKVSSGKKGEGSGGFSYVGRLGSFDVGVPPRALCGRACGNHLRGEVSRVVKHLLALSPQLSPRGMFPV